MHSQNTPGSFWTLQIFGKRDFLLAMSYRASILLLVCFLMAGSAFSEHKKTDAKAASARQELNYGYALLHKGVNGLVWADHYLKVKQEQASFRDFMQAMQDNARGIMADLDRIQKAYPALDYSSTGQPQIIQKKDKRVTKDRIISLAPFVGRTGIDFERTLLLTSAAICNQMRHLSHVLLDEEPDKGLKEVLTGIEKRLNQQYTLINEHLNQHYFIQEK